MKPSELVRKGWCQGCAAVNKNGSEVSANSPERESVCAHTAVMSIEDQWNRRRFMTRLQDMTGGWVISVWNDDPSRTQAEVIAALEAVEKEMGI